MKKKYALLSILVSLSILIIGNSAFAFSYFLTSVWNERKSYDSTYFLEGEFNDIMAGIILEGFGGTPTDLDYQIEWPQGAVTNTSSVPFKTMYYGKPAYIATLGHDVTSFGEWEGITYDFSEGTGVSPQPSDIFVTSGTFQELPAPTVKSYDPTAHSIVWENNYEVEDLTNFRIRIYGSIDRYDVLFDSGNVLASANSYTFLDSTAIGLLDSGAIFGVEARKFKSPTEFEYNSIYITRSSPVPEPATMLLLGTGLVGLAGFGRKKFFRK